MPSSHKADQSGNWTTVREATFDFFRSVGVDTFFGNPGSTELAMLDRWPDDIHYVLGLHEASVVGMADGYARATGKAAFVNVHSAAGLGHALGNVYTAFRNRAPMVIIAGQQSRELLPNQPFLGATDAADFPKPYVKYSIEPARAEDVPAAIAHAYRIAMQRPFGPTFVSVPADDWNVRCKPLSLRQVSSETSPDPHMISDAAAMISKAKSVAFVVGAEIDEEGAGEALVKLAERLQAPVYAAPFAARVTFPENHELFAGFLSAAPAKVSATLIEYDLVVAIGAPVFTYHVPGESDLADSHTSIIHLTTDTHAASSAPLGTSIVGSLKFSLPLLEELTVGRPPKPRPISRPQPTAPKPSEHIFPDYFLYRLGQEMTPDTVLFEETPSVRPALQDFVRVQTWGKFFTMASGGLGYGLPGAVGYGIAKPEQKVVCLIGDGSFMYSPQALWTAVQHNLDLAIIVLNNSGYGAMRSFSKILQVRDVPGIELQDLDFLDLAKGMGCTAQRVEASSELDDQFSKFMAGSGPRLLEVVIDPGVQTLY
ncbi:MULTISPECIES: benzoylformate decarboxylase [Thalassospira]|uniref:benzoylformate decarboxylase n=1 Tax=Thalassospira TaxID=168934 RepID=UPI0008DD8DE6|nr:MULTISPECIES: benzoylformate decarboxylase [Thalassospira]MCD1594387.1 benzoylformate decarboxylase [Thalassospira xiamenensis]MDM7978146.1 benzoylformate decarboxylase [Thalassospira xiamenensis]OHY99034.1 benzoylformate decarboxylase [Thalassospira sp. MIT1004]